MSLSKDWIVSKTLQTNRVALITDASHPATGDIVARLERDGLLVIKNYPRQDGKGTIAGVPYCYAFDTWSLADMHQLLELITADVGVISYLIHTDNIIVRSSLEHIAEQDFMKSLDYNTKSAFMTTKVFGEHIAQNGGGAIVYLSSLHDEKPTGCSFAYSVAKGAVKMLCEETALFYGRKGVRTNIVEMDYLKDQEKLFDSLLSPFNYDAQTKIPLGRLAQPSDFAGLVSFLISEDAAFVNGAAIRVDGGHFLYY